MTALVLQRFSLEHAPVIDGIRALPFRQDNQDYLYCADVNTGDEWCLTLEELRKHPSLQWLTGFKMAADAAGYKYETIRGLTRGLYILTSDILRELRDIAISLDTQQQANTILELTDVAPDDNFNPVGDMMGRLQDIYPAESASYRDVIKRQPSWFTATALPGIRDHFCRARDTYEAMDTRDKLRLGGIAKTIKSQFIALAAASMATQPAPYTDTIPGISNTLEVETIGFTDRQVFDARMELFRKSGKMPAWVEDSAQATLDLDKKASRILRDGGFTSIDHAHAQSLVTATIESVFNTRPTTPHSSARGAHHFFWDTAQDVMREYPEIKQLLKKRGLNPNDPDIRYNAYASALFYYGYSAQTMRLFKHEANKYLDDLIERKIIKPEQRDELLETAVANTVNYDRHVSGARGSAKLHIRVQISPNMKAETIIGSFATSRNESIFGHGHTAAESLDILRHRVAEGTRVHLYHFPYKSSTYRHLLPQANVGKGPCKLGQPIQIVSAQAQVFRGYTAR